MTGCDTLSIRAAQTPEKEFTNLVPNEVFLPKWQFRTFDCTFSHFRSPLWALSLPESFGFGAVFVACIAQVLAQFFGCQTEVFTQLLQRVIFVAQFHIDEADEYVRIVRNIHFFEILLQSYNFFCVYAKILLPLHRIMDEKQNIGSLFDRIASTYDGLNHGLSLNIDRIWRRKTVAKMQSVRQVLDVAIGTADLTVEMIRQHKALQVTGLDLSQQMMAIGEEKIKQLKEKGQLSQSAEVRFVYGNAQEMPFADSSFDAVSCAFGCRNFSNLDDGLREMYRVLKPGGQLVILEFSYPTNRLVRALYNIYFTYILTFVGRIVSRDQTAYTYLNRSVKGFIWGEKFVHHLHDIGFEREHFTPLTFGIATIYTAYKHG